MGMVKLAFIINFITLSVYAGQGVIDATFGTNGVKDTTFANPTLIVDSVVSGNKIWFAGIASFDPRGHVIYGRFSLDGTLDFSNIVRPCNADPNNLQDSTSSVNKISLQPDGKLLVTGKCQTFNAGNFQNPYAIRINTNGTLDSSFGIGGIALLDLRTVPACGTLQTTYDIAVAPDGNIIAVGGDGVTPVSSGGCPGAIPAAILLKISPVGAVLTPTYFPQPGVGRFQGLTIQPDGKILVGYNDDAATAGVYQIRRFNSDFTPDTSFGTNGTATFPVGTGDPRGNVTSIHLESSGKIVVIGYVAPNSAKPSIARFLPNGTLDTTFNGTGSLRFPDDQNVNMTVNKISRQPDGRYLISGPISDGWGVYRVNPNGTLDSTYGNRTAPGIAWFNPPTGRATGVPAILPDGSMIQIGSANSVVFNTIIRLVKINQNQNRLANGFDFDGDGRADVSIFRPSSGTWFLNRSNAGFGTEQFGISSDKLAPADYDGDGKTDIAVWRESEGNFYILNSANNSVRTENFGLPGDVLMVGDWDGDDKADLSTYRGGAQSMFFYRGSLNNPNNNITSRQWGTSGDKPMRGDFDGDGKADAAVFRPSNNVWYIHQSSNNQIRYDYWGLSTDKFVTADYDGDAKTDLAIFRNGVWHIKQSSNNQPQYVYWGLSTDKLVAADYDGDGKTDTAVFRNGIWYLNQTTGGSAVANFGLSTDSPVPNAYIAP